MTDPPSLPHRVAWWQPHAQGGHVRVYADPKSPRFQVNFLSPNGTAYVTRWDFLEEQLVERSGEVLKLMRVATTQTAASSIPKDKVQAILADIEAVQRTLKLDEPMSERDVEDMIERFYRAAQLIMTTISAQGGIA